MALDKVHLAIAGAAVLAMAIVGKLWLDAHDANIRAEASNVVLSKALNESQDAIKSAKADQAKIASDLNAQLAAIAQQRTVIVTPQQAVEKIPQIVPNLPQPVTVVPEGLTDNGINHNAGDLIVPKEDIPNFQEYVLDCKENSAKLDACQLNTAAMQTQLDAEKKIADDYEAQVQNLKKAQGSGFWHRLKECGIRTGIGGAAGAAGGGQRGAIIGGSIGIGTCLIFK